MAIRRRPGCARGAVSRRVIEPYPCSCAQGTFSTRHECRAHAVERQIVDTVHTQDTVLDILETARAHHCGTVVVGRKSYHGLTALLTSHVSDEVIRQGQDLAVWVVE